MPQYRYAYDPQGHLVDVLDLPVLRDELAASFVCVGCGQPLIAKTKGERREKHFAHKVVTPTCTEETYLHKLAKQAFFDEYQHCLDHQEPYEIELAHPATCSAYQELLGENCSLSVTKMHDLTRFYRALKLEQRDGSFVPDLLLYHPEHPERPLLYIEIAVTHFLSDQKVSSDRRIIEIPIESEADIAKIRRRRLTRADARFVNFQPSAQAASPAECSCAANIYNGLVVYSNGKSFLLNDTLATIDAEYRRINDQGKRILLQRGGRMAEGMRGWVFKRMVHEAADQGFPIRNCYLCRYVGEDPPWDADAPVFCKWLRKACGTNEAADCTYFRTKKPTQPPGGFQRKL